MKRSFEHRAYWPRVSSYLDADESVASGTAEALTLTTVNFETASGFAPTPAGVGTTFTVPCDGLWLIHGGIQWASDSTADKYRYVYLYKNAAFLHTLSLVNNVESANNTIIGGSCQAVLAKGDTLEIYAGQNSGAALNALTSGSTYLSAILLGK